MKRLVLAGALAVACLLLPASPPAAHVQRWAVPYRVAGDSHTGALGSSQPATELPDGSTRAVVGANLAAAVPLAMLAITAGRRFPVDWAKVTAGRGAAQ